MSDVILPFHTSHPLAGKMKSEWKKGDVAGVFCCMDSFRYFDFIFDNLAAIQNRGLINEFVCHAYVGTKSNLSMYSFPTIKFLFELCDKDALKKLGDPFEEKPCYELYRGVAGKGSARRLRGLSWTNSFDKAQWFAKRFNLEKPFVYTTKVKYDDVYFYTNQREESEFVCHIPAEAKLKRVA